MATRKEEDTRVARGLVAKEASKVENLEDLAKKEARYSTIMYSVKSRMLYLFPMLSQFLISR